MSRSKKVAAATLVRALGVIIGLGLLLFTFASADWNLVQSRLSAAGPALLLAVVPFALAAVLDVQALRGVLRLLGSEVRLQALGVVHLAGEATAMSLPLGAVASDPLRVYLLQQRGGVPAATGVTATAARKYLLIATEGVAVGLGAWLGAGALTMFSEAAFGNRILPWVAWCIALGLTLLGAGYAVLMRDGSIAGRVFALLRRVSPQRFTARLEQAQSTFSHTDDLLARFFRLPPSRLLGVASGYLGVWLLEALETYVALRLLGAPITWEAALCMESLLSFVRALATVLPAGLGIQDLGYMLFLRSLGVPDANSVGAAFAVFKRLKEAAWVALGYGLWSWTPGHTRAPELERAT